MGTERRGKAMANAVGLRVNVARRSRARKSRQAEEDGGRRPEKKENAEGTDETRRGEERS